MNKFSLKISILSLLVVFNGTSFGMLLPFLNSGNYKNKVLSDYQRTAKSRFPSVWGAILMKKSIDLFNESIPSSDIDHLYRDDIHRLEPLSKLPAKERLQKASYKDIQNRSSIDSLQKQRLKVLLELPDSVAKKLILEQFQQLDEKLKNDEIEAENNLALKIGIKPNDWIEKKAFATAFNNHFIGTLKEEKGTTRDKKLHPEWIRSIEAAMKMNGLHPTAAHLACSRDNGNSFALHVTGCQPHNNILSPSTIDLNENINNAINRPKTWLALIYESIMRFFYEPVMPVGPEILQHAACHEVAHMIKGDAIAQSMMLSEAMKVIPDEMVSCKMIEEKLSNFDEYFKWILAIERRADAFHVIKNADIARSTRAMGDHPYWGSYNYFAIADTNWRALAEIEKKINKNI